MVMDRQPVLDRRRRVRRDISLMVCYRPNETTAGYDITQTRNLDQDGMLMTTARGFERGVRLTVRLTLPVPHPVAQAAVEVVDCKEVVENLMYETRVRFIDLDRWSLRIIGDLCARAGG